MILDYSIIDVDITFFIFFSYCLIYFFKLASNSNAKRYTLGGFLFGLLFPLFSWILDGLFFNELSLGFDMVARIHINNPIHFIIDSAPFVLAIAFGTMGFYMDRLKEKSLLVHENIVNYNKENEAIIKRMQLTNTIFPVIIGLILLIGFLLLQDFSNKEQEDIRITKVGNSQNLLSQKIIYHASKIPVTELEEKIKHTDSLLLSLKNFKEGHIDLTKKSTLLESSEGNNGDFQNSFDTLTSSYENIIKGIDELLNPNFVIKNVDSLSLQNHAIKTVRQLERNQEEFSAIMQSIVNIHEREAKDKIITLKVIQSAVVAIIIVFVILLAVFGLKPMIDRVKQAFLDVEEANIKIVRSNETLKASEEELRINAEEMGAVNEHMMNSQYKLEQKQDLLKRAEKMAKMGSFSWNLKKQTVEHSDNLPSIYRLEEGKRLRHSFSKTFPIQRIIKKTKKNYPKQR